MSALRFLGRFRLPIALENRSSLNGVSNVSGPTPQNILSCQQRSLTLDSTLSTKWNKYNNGPQKWLKYNKIVHPPQGPNEEPRKAVCITEGRELTFSLVVSAKKDSIYINL